MTTRARRSTAPGCAVATTPVGYVEPPRAIERVGVGYNGSSESEHAFGGAGKLARRLGASLAAFEAVSIPPGVSWLGGAGRDDDRRTGQ